jgi:hypothetical protein
MEIFHASSSKQEPICNKILAHSTPYRWITCLGDLREILRSAQDMILRKNPASNVCRDLACCLANYFDAETVESFTMS